MARNWYLAVVCIGLCLSDSVAPVWAESRPLLVAVSSYRNRPMHPEILFFKVDSGGAVQPAGGIPAVPKRSDHHPALSADGRFCAFASEAEGQPCVVLLWSLLEKKLVDLPGLNDSPNAQAAPAISATGDLLVLDAWAKPSLPGRWDLLRYDVPAKKASPLALNQTRRDERAATVSGDGQTLVFTVAGDSPRPTDLALVNLSSGETDPLAEANSPGVETDPALSADGRWLAFVSDRNAKESGPDLFLFDRTMRSLADLSGLNSTGNEQAPCFSPEGRYLAFVTERLDGAGERDIALYDRERGVLISLPGLNSPLDDMDPALTWAIGE
jgi:Tol biopolymer transport system component